MPKIDEPDKQKTTISQEDRKKKWLYIKSKCKKKKKEK